MITSENTLYVKLISFFLILAIDLMTTKVDVKMSFLLFIFIVPCFSSFRGHKMGKQFGKTGVVQGVHLNSNEGRKKLKILKQKKSRLKKNQSMEPEPVVSSEEMSWSYFHQ